VELLPSEVLHIPGLSYDGLKGYSVIHLMREAISQAIDNLRANKLRSFLTLLGIILATTTLIAVMSVINGMNAYVAENVSNMGSDGFKIMRIVIMDWDPKKYLEMMRRNPEMKLEEFEFLQTRMTMVRELGIEAMRNVGVHCGKEQRDRVRLTGATPNLGVITNTQPAAGRFLTEIENHRRMQVAFIGNDLREQFFPNVNPIGKSIDIQGRPFEVIGVAKAKGSVFGTSQDAFVMIPIETYFKIYGARSGMAFSALALDYAHLHRALEEARMLLRAYRHVRPGDDDNFSMVTSNSLVAFWEQLTSAMAATAVAIVSVFMVVGGVVVMNIMLAVVTERTHEIGIRKSVGARRKDILNQFLVESVILAASGGIIGIVLAWLVAIVVRSLTPVPMKLPVVAVFVGVTLSASVGLFFGIYPARRASKLDPIEALRMER
jgi:putative ABC transport system permease protein